MVLLVEALVERLGLRLELLHEGVNGLVEGVHVGPVACMVVLVPREHKFLKLVEKVYLALHGLVVGWFGGGVVW